MELVGVLDFFAQNSVLDLEVDVVFVRDHGERETTDADTGADDHRRDPQENGRSDRRKTELHAQGVQAQAAHDPVFAAKGETRGNVVGVAEDVAETAEPVVGVAGVTEITIPNLGFVRVVVLALVGEVIGRLVREVAVEMHVVSVRTKARCENLRTQSGFGIVDAPGTGVGSSVELH